MVKKQSTLFERLLLACVLEFQYLYTSSFLFPFFPIFFFFFRLVQEPRLPAAAGERCPSQQKLTARWREVGNMQKQPRLKKNLPSPHLHPRGLNGWPSVFSDTPLSRRILIPGVYLPSYLTDTPVLELAIGFIPPVLPACLAKRPSPHGLLLLLRPSLELCGCMIAR